MTEFKLPNYSGEWIQYEDPFTKYELRNTSKLPSYSGEWVKGPVYPQNVEPTDVLDRTTKTPVVNRGNNVGNVQFKGSPSKLARAKAALKDTAAVVKNGLGNVPLRAVGNAALGLSAIEAIADSSAKNHASRPEVQADWEAFKASDYMNFNPAIHDADYSDDMKQAIMQMAPAANALNLRKNTLDSLNALAKEEQLLASEKANREDSAALFDNLKPTEWGLTPEEQLARSTGNWDFKATASAEKSKTNKNSLDGLGALLGLLALGAGGYYLGKKL